MGNAIDKPLDTNDNDTTLDNNNIIYDENIKNFEDALRMSIAKFRDRDVNHLIGYPEKQTFTITSFEKYENLYYYYTNNVFFDCDYIINLRVTTEGNEKIRMFIELYDYIYDTNDTNDINDTLKILTLSKYGKNIRFIFCTLSPIVSPFCVSYDAYVASNNYRKYLLTGQFTHTNIEYKDGTIYHRSPYTKTKVNRICRKFLEDVISNETSSAN